MAEPTEQDLKYGWFFFKPRWLQIVNNSKCFLFVVVILASVQSMIVNGITSINIPALEKRFQLSSKDLGLIVASNDISAILLVCFVSFYGEFGNKIKWLGYGALITAIGCFVFFLPHALISPYQPVLGNTTLSSRQVEECVINNGSSTNDACFSGYESNRLYLLIFCIAQLLMGAGTTPLYSLAPAYIDENVHPKAAPIYLGIFFTAAVAGMGLGFAIGGPILNEIYVQIKQPEGAKLTSSNPQWIGAWWLAYIAAGTVMFVGAIFVLGFPSELPGSKEMRDKAIEKGDLPKKDNKLRGKLRDIVPATVKLLKNPTYMFNTLAITAESLIGAGLGAFIAKFAQLKFGLDPGMAGLTLGTVFVLCATGGTMLSGVIVRKFNLKKSCRLSAKCCLLFYVLTIWTTTCFIVPGCDQVNLAGVVKPYFNGHLQTRSPVAPCNINCSCSIANINPVCGGDKLTYFSPCHAGCSKVAGLKAFNCSCIGDVVNGTQATAEKGFCDRGPGCKNFIYFLVISAVLLLAVFLTAIPNKTVALRCVPDNQRSYALGFQFIFQRSFGFLPGPVVVGWVFDSLCLFWGESCGIRGRCQIYDIWNLSVSMIVFETILKAVAVLFYFLSFWFCKSSYEEGSQIGDQQNERNESIGEPHTETVL
ncbi:solute carrier organic anion transporter family member 4A1-like [Oculina patagonica]